MRILAVHRYFWPDSPPYAVMLREIAQAWVADGHAVSVLSSQPSYKGEPETAWVPSPSAGPHERFRIRRLRLPHEQGRPLTRVRNALMLGSAVVAEALRGKYDLIMISTMPPVVGGAAALLAARLSGARFFYHCMDLHPEIGRLSGEFAHPLVYWALERIEAANCREADAVIVLSDDMADAVRSRPGCSRAKIVVLNNFSLPSGENPSKEADLPADLAPTGRLRVLFAGNVGRFQGLETAVDAMAGLAAADRDDVELMIMGEGSAVDELKDQARARGVDHLVRFAPHQPVDVAKAAMAQADLGLVSLVPGMYRYAYPSKTMTYLEQGCPLLLCVEPESQLAHMVRAEQIGVDVPPGDSERMAHAIAALADNRLLLAEMSAKARAVAAREFDQAAVLERWSRLLTEVAV